MSSFPPKVLPTDGPLDLGKHVRFFKFFKESKIRRLRLYGNWTCPAVDRVHDQLAHWLNFKAWMTVAGWPGSALPRAMPSTSASQRSRQMSWTKYCCCSVCTNRVCLQPAIRCVLLSQSSSTKSIKTHFVKRQVSTLKHRHLRLLDSHRAGNMSCSIYGEGRQQDSSAASR